MSDRFRIRGIVRAREFPQEWDIATFKYWWCDEYDAYGQLLHRARMSPKEKDRYTTYERENLITTNGIVALLNNACATSTGSMIPFGVIFAAGNGATPGVARSDTSMAGEAGLTNNRKAQTGSSITGSQVDIAYVYGSGDANGPWTNIGLWGNGASTTIGSGTLYTHALYSYNKPSASVTIDYLLLLSN